jgi:hypothetical protein
VRFACELKQWSLLLYVFVMGFLRPIHVRCSSVSIGIFSREALAERKCRSYFSKIFLFLCSEFCVSHERIERVGLGCNNEATKLSQWTCLPCASAKFNLEIMMQCVLSRCNGNDGERNVTRSQQTIKARLIPRDVTSAAEIALLFYM